TGKPRGVTGKPRGATGGPRGRASVWSASSAEQGSGRQPLRILLGPAQGHELVAMPGLGLDGAVLQLVALAEAAADGGDDIGTVVAAVEDDVDGEDVEAVGDRPDVEVVIRGHAGDAAEGLLDVGEVDLDGAALHQHAGGLQHQAPAAPEH